jgi:inner membrane transporter RhtA
VRAVILVLIAAIGMQIAAVLAMTLFADLGVPATGGLRFALAAVLLLALLRPRLRGRSRGEWAGILIYGVAMALMNLLIFLAIDRLPLGVATTIEFLGPCLVALAASRHLREALLAVVAFVGVALIAGLGGPLDPLGLVFAAGAAVCFGLYTLLAARVGKSSGGLPSVALSVAVAAILTLPFSVPAAPTVSPGQWGVLLLSAAIGTAFAFTADTYAGRLTSARVIGVLFSFNPVVGTIIGVVALGQMLTLPALAGIVLVVVAGAGIVWLAGRRVEP